MHVVYLILFFIPVVVIPWLVGRLLSRWSPGLRHLPWIALTAAGCGLLFLWKDLNSGNSLWSELSDFFGQALAVALCVGGCVAGALTWLFPGTHLRRLGPTPSRASSNPDHRPPGTATERPSTYALLRQEVEPDISVDALIQASRSVTSIQEADCRMIYAHAGILFRDLTKEDAIRLRGALRSQGHPVHLVEETLLYTLPRGRRAQALRLEEDVLVETDSLGRDHRHSIQRIEWSGAGRLEEKVYREHEKIKTRTVHTMGGHAREEIYREKDRGMEDLTSLRFEILLPGEPWRIIWDCDEHQRRRLQNKPVGPADTEAFSAFLLELRTKMAPERLNPGIRNIGSHPLWVYPSLKAFEDEIRWTLTCRKMAKPEAIP